MIKDYYEILGLPPHATLPEIKQAYRRLAKQYHPDTNMGDQYAANKFGEIKEAHDILTNPAKKDSYLQERWYNQSLGKKRTATSVDPVSILRLSLELERYVSTLDIHRMNKEELSDYIKELISTSTIDQLLLFNEPLIHRQIVSTILLAMEPLPYSMADAHIDQLKKLAGMDHLANRKIRDYVVRHRSKARWARYRVWLVLLFTIIICLLIYFTSK